MYTIRWMVEHAGNREVIGNYNAIYSLYSYLIVDKKVYGIHVYDGGTEVNPERGLVSFVMLACEDRLRNSSSDLFVYH